MLLGEHEAQFLVARSVGHGEVHVSVHESWKQEPSPRIDDKVGAGGSGPGGPHVRDDSVGELHVGVGARLRAGAVDHCGTNDAGGANGGRSGGQAN